MKNFNMIKMLIIIVDNNEIDDKNDEIKVENEIENWVEVLWENFYLIFTYLTCVHIFCISFAIIGFHPYLAINDCFYKDMECLRFSILKPLCSAYTSYFYVFNDCFYKDMECLESKFSWALCLLSQRYFHIHNSEKLFYLFYSSCYNIGDFRT